MILKAVLLLALVSIPSYILGRYFPMPGGPVFAMVLGIILAPLATKFNAASFSQKVSKKALLWSVIFLGLGINAVELAKLSATTWIYMIITVIFGLSVTAIFAKILGLKGPVALLVSVGTSICGGSAIAAVAGMSNAKEDETAQALSTIFLFNIIAAVVYPFLGHALQMDAHHFGEWAGTAINDTSSVLAASFAYGADQSGDAGTIGMIVKMARTLMILPVSLGVAFLMKNKIQGDSKGKWKKALPVPAIGFGIAIIIHYLVSAAGAPELTWSVTKEIGHILMIVALAAVGLVSNLAKMWKTGKLAIFAGGLGSISLGVFSYFLHIL